MSKNRTARTIRLLAAATALAPCLAVSTYAETPADLLDRLEMKRSALDTIRQTTTTTIRETGVSRKVILRTWQKRAGEILKRRDIRETKTSLEGGAETVAKTLTVSDGRSQWAESEVRGKIFVIKSKPVFAGDFDLLRKRIGAGRARVRPNETVDGRRCAVIEVVGGKDTGRFKATYWIVEEFGVLLKSRLVAANHALTEMVTSELKVNEPIIDAMFDYAAPEGASVIDADTLGSKADDNRHP